MAFRLVLIALVFFAIPLLQPADARPVVKTVWKYYPITGRTSRQLINQMRRKGPQGYWAFARWYVRWSGTCRTSVRITYTFPRWVDKNRAPASLRKAWDRMIRNLKRHERGHGQHGINAAREIEKSRCRFDPKRITRKWAAQDKIYDRRTRHGITQGVRLP